MPGWSWRKLVENDAQDIQNILILYDAAVTNTWTTSSNILYVSNTFKQSEEEIFRAKS